MSTKKVQLVTLAILSFALSSLVYGQANGSLSGTVADKTGGVLTGATVKITSQATGLQRDTKTDDSGHYLVPLLPVSIYTIHVEAQGFQTTEQRDIRLQVDEAREIDFALNPASVSQSVEVSATEVAIETTNPSLGQVINEQQVSQLPLNGRDFVQLASLTPGATQETNPNSFFTSGADSEVAARGSFSLSVGGSRPNSTDWLLDGVDNNELTAGGIGIFSSIDDIQEFKVLTYNYSAEYGTRAGPTVLVTSKSGANQFHGSLFEFLRNTDLDAKSFFATSAEKFNLNQFGGSIGGPIRKDKTFFFVDGEQKYQRHGIAFAGLVPSLAMRNGDFTNDPFGNPVTGTATIAGTTYTGLPGIVNPNMVTPSNIALSADPTVFPNAYFQCDDSGNPLPANSDGSQAPGTNCAKIPTGANGLANPIGQALINLYPAPNANGNGFNFVNAPVRSLNETKLDLRLDHNISAADSLFARFSYDQANSYVPGGAGDGFTEQSAFGSNQRIANHGRQIALGETHTFSPTTVNQATFGYNRIFNYILSQGTGTCASANIAGVGIPGANLGCTGSPGDATCGAGEYSCGLVSVLMFGGYWSIGDRGYSPFQGGTNIFSFGDTLDLIRGKHDIKVGFGFRANQMNVGTEAFQDGFWIPGVAGNFSGFNCTTPSPGCPDPATNSVSVGGSPEADVLLGILGLAEHDQTFNGPVTGRRWKTYRPFVQDDWRITKDLTLNLGVAWDMTTPITEQHGRIANYDPVGNKLLVAGQDGVNSAAGIQMNWKDFEPRIGFAWKVLGSDKTVVRAGYGIFHDSAWSQGAQGLWQNPPFFAESDFFGPAGCAFSTSYCVDGFAAPQTPLGLSMSTGFPIFSGPPDLSTFEGTLFTQPTNFKHGNVQQFNANVERQLPGNVVLTAGYAGARGHHILISGNNLNTFGPAASVCATNPIGCNPDGSQYIPQPAANGVFNSILEFGDIGDTTYNSLQIKAETKTPRYGLYALVSYTYSRTYDNGLSDGLGSLLSAPYFPLPNWQKLDWAPSQIGLHNNFTASVIYDLPFGKGKKFGGGWSDLTNTLLGNWQLTLIEHVTSGFPVPLIDSFNQSGVFFNAGGNGNNYNRPNQVAGCDPYSANHSRQQWINTSCFTVSTVGLGNANRVPVVGPDFVNTDFSVIKQFALPREGMGLNFRAEFFNLFNHAQFGMPGNDISGFGFGSVTSTVNNPRLVQLALKLTF